MKFIVNSNCIGCGLCASICSDVFSMTDENKASSDMNYVSGQTEALAFQAMNQCPVNAIESVM